MEEFNKMGATSTKILDAVLLVSGTAITMEPYSVQYMPCVLHRHRAQEESDLEADAGTSQARGSWGRKVSALFSEARTLREAPM